MNAQGEAILSLARRRGLLDDARLKSARKLEGDGPRIRAGLEKLGLDSGSLAKLVRELTGKTFRCGRCNAEFSFEALASLEVLSCGRCALPLAASERSEAKKKGDSRKGESKKNAKLTTSRTRLSTATEIGPYKLVKLIGKGASGVVHLARKEGLDRDFAIKVLTANVFEDQLALERFRREAHIASRLQHPGIVSVVDVGESEGNHYYVMEHVAGPTLQAHFKDKGPLPPKDAARLVAEVARAMAFAHEHEIVHRDLKPANVILDDKTGKPRITDFGLARDGRDHRVTRTGDILGTPYYMAPEQFTGDKDLDGRTDVWALGVMLFEALTGERPFEAKTSAMLATTVLTGEIRSPSELAPGVPKALDAICRRCLSRRVDLRYAKASELADDLDAFRKGAKVVAAPETKIEQAVRKSRRHVGAKQLAIAGLVVGALGGALVLHLLGKLSTPAVVVPAGDPVERLLDENASLVKIRLEVEKRKTELPPRLAERWAARLLRAGCYADALAVAGPLKNDPASVESASRISAEASAKLGELAPAAEHLAKLAASDPSARARRLFFERKYVEASEAGLAAIAAHPTDAGARRTVAVALLRRADAASNAARAFKFAQEALDLEPNEPDSHVVWAYAARAAGRPLDAVEAALDQAFALTSPEPPDPLASLTRAWSALQRRDAKKAKAALDSPQLRGSEDPEVLALQFWSRFALDQEDWLDARKKGQRSPAFDAALDELARLIRGPARAPLSLEAGDRIDRLLEGVDKEARPAVRRALLAAFEGAPGTASDEWWKLARALAPACPRTAVLHARALVGRERSGSAERAIEAARKLDGVDTVELDRLDADRLWRLGRVSQAAEIWGRLQRQPGWVGDYSRGALEVARHRNAPVLNTFFSKAIERTPDRAELYRLHAHALLVGNPLFHESSKAAALVHARRAMEIEGALDAENLFLNEYGAWSLKAGDDRFVPTDEFYERTGALGASFAALAPETSRFAYVIYRVAMKWPLASTRAIASLEEAARRDKQPWALLARAWLPLREGVGKQRQGLSFQEDAAQLVEALRACKRVDPEFWIPHDVVNRLTEWKVLPDDLKNPPLPP